MIPRHLLRSNRIVRPTRHPMAPEIEESKLPDLGAEVDGSPAPVVEEPVVESGTAEAPVVEEPVVESGTTEAEETPVIEAEEVQEKPTWSEDMTRSTLVTVVESVGMVAGNKSKADLVKMLRGSDLVTEK